jgi:hypothetical protein
MVDSVWSIDHLSKGASDPPEAGARPYLFGDPGHCRRSDLAQPNVDQHRGRFALDSSNGGPSKHVTTSGNLSR